MGPSVVTGIGPPKRTGFIAMGRREPVAGSDVLIARVHGGCGTIDGEETAMPKLRVHNFSISLDGYGAGPDQSVEEPLGVGGEELHEWIFRTRTGGTPRPS